MVELAACEDGFPAVGRAVVGVESLCGGVVVDLDTFGGWQWSANYISIVLGVSSLTQTLTVKVACVRKASSISAQKSG